MTPVSLIFLSVPESSCASAWAAKTTALSATPIKRRPFILISLKTPTPSITLSETNISPQAKTGPLLASGTLHHLIGIRIGGVGGLVKFMPELRSHRHAEIETLR